MDKKIDLFSIVNLSVDILQNSRFKLEERLILLGLAYKNLSENINNNDFSFEKWNNKYSIFADDYDITELIKSIKPNNALYVLNNIKTAFESKKFDIGDIEYVIEKIENNEIKISYNTEKYEDLKEKYNNFIADKEYFMENYIINNLLEYINEINSNNIYDFYVHFVNKYGFTKFILICNMDKILNGNAKNNFIDTITRISHSTIHGKSLEEVYDNNKDWDKDLGYIINILYH